MNPVPVAQPISREAEVATAVAAVKRRASQIVTACVAAGMGDIASRLIEDPTETVESVQAMLATITPPTKPGATECISGLSQTNAPRTAQAETESQDDSECIA